MKIGCVFAVILAVLAPCLVATSQTTNTAPVDPSTIPAGPTGPAVPSGPALPVVDTASITNATSSELAPRPLPAGRSVSYTPLVGPETISGNPPANDEVVEVVSFDALALPEAINALAQQAGLNIIFDPTLLIAPDGHQLTPPPVTLKWRKLTAMQALRALLETWQWQMAWDPKNEVGRITRKDLNVKEPLLVTILSLRYGNPTNILKEVQDTLSPGSSIVADMRTHQLIVRTTEKELAGVSALIVKLDLPTRQILVEARIVETSKDIATAKGVDWTGTLQNQHISFGNGLTQGTVVNSATTGPNQTTGTVSPSGSPIGSGPSSITTLSSNISTITTTLSGNTSQSGGFSMNTAHGFSPATAFLNADGVQAVLSFLNTDSDSKTIAFPRTVALDGVPTEFVSVQNVPIFIQTQSAPAGGSAAGLATIQPSYNLAVQGTILNEVGVKLLVTPRIAGPTNVLLDLKPEISQQLPGLVSETLNGQVNEAPAFSRNRITTQAAVPSGFTLVLGGMDQDVVNKTFTKVPFFGDIPGLGNVFRSDSKSHAAETILIFVTPTILSDLDYQATDSTFLKRKPVPATEQNEPSWDRAEPYDWTKPKNQVAPDYQP